MDYLKCVTLNVRGLGNRDKRLKLFNYLKEKKTDVILLQETFCTNELCDTFNKDWDGAVYHSSAPTSHGKGVCIMLSNTVDFEFISCHTDSNGRRILLNVDIHGHIYSFVSIYCPNGINDRKDFLNSSYKWISENALTCDNIVCGGDFNSVLNSLDRKNSNFCKKSADLLKVFMNKLKLDDTWRAFNKSVNEFTYIDPSDRNRDSRIDYLFLSLSLSKNSMNCTICNAPVPDHNAVFVDINISINPRGPGYWKLNVSILENDDYIKGIHDLIDRTVADYNDVGDKLVWELCKVRIREYSICYCSNLSRIHKTQVTVLEDRLRNGIYKDNGERKTIKEQLDRLYMNNAKGAQIRSRARYVEEGEKSTSFFLGLEKKRQKDNTLRSIKYDNEIHTSTEGLLNAVANFYEELYSSCKPKSNDISSYLQNITDIKTLSDDERDSIEGKITMDEATKAIRSLKPNKSPGLDGIPSEFYVKFWDKIGDIIVKSFNESYDDGELSESQRMAVISLIFKKGDAQLLQNYRPISLTNSDYKILAFCLANRLQLVIKSIINPGQVAYIKGRYIGNNIRLVEDIIEYYENNELGGILFALDFKKAFDSLEWEFLFQVLQKFNFGDMFISWVKTLYTHPLAYIKNNGYLSRHIEIKRSIRQGCPVSCLLFIIAVEIMGNKIRNEDRIKGVVIPNCTKKVKILQYADDGICFLNDTDELELLIRIVTEFGQLSGTKLNLTKCEGLWYGIYKERQINCNLLNIKWPLEPIRCLGIYIGNDKECNYKLNWTNRIESIRALLQSWKKRDLTVFGKVCIIKQLAIPKILYSASMLYTPDNIVKEINSMFYEFIWGKREFVKRGVMIADVIDGGCNMIDVESLFHSVKCSWAIRLLNAHEDELWPVIAKNVYDLKRKDFLLFRLSFTNCKKALFISNLPLFYQQILCAFNKAKCISHDHFCNTILEQPLWGNDFITCDTQHGKNMTLFYQGWIDNSIVKVGDLRFVDGTMDENFVYQVIKKKRNILSEVSRLKKALRPYSNLIGNHEPDNEHFLPLFSHPDFMCDSFSDSKSKFFYNKLVTKKINRPVAIETYWSNLFNNMNIEFGTVYRNKIAVIKDKKMAEFNLKILHNILPCNANLYKWKQKPSDLCSTCNVVEDLPHMLYHCVFAKIIWDKVNLYSNLTLLDTDVILGVNLSPCENLIVTLISYHIYKMWLRQSYDNVPRNVLTVLHQLKLELRHIHELYSHLHCEELCGKLQHVISIL